MPEGAEVKIISEGLAKNVSSRKLSRVTALSGRYTRKPIPGLELFTPGKVTGVGVKGKLIFWMLGNDTYLLNTLGMTGTWSSTKSKHAHIRFDFDEGEPVYYVDMRNFGTLKFIKGKSNFLQKLNSLGPDMLNDDVTHAQFAESLDKKPHWSLAKALMNQSIICGVGNYVKAEALYKAELSPWRTVGSLSGKEMRVLNDAIKTVLRQSYIAQGASLRNYVSYDGVEGEAVFEFLVYGRKKDPCGNDVVRDKTDDGRTTHWVPEVQN